MMSTMEKVLYLKRLDLFREFPGRELGAIAHIVTEEALDKGDVLMRRNDPGDALYLIVDGHMSVVRPIRGEDKVVAIVGPDECVGEMAILGDQPRIATIEAIEPCRVLKIDRDDFRALIMRKPQMAFALFRILLRRIDEVRESKSKV